MQILTILEPSTTDLEPTSHSTDNTGLTAALVSAAMAGANPIGISLLKRTVCGSRQADTGILKLRSVVLDEAKRRQWKYESEKRINLLSDLCVLEFTNMPLCKTCYGSKVVISAENVTREECPTCKGTGNGEFTATSRAQWLEVSRNTYYKTWDKRRLHINKIFDDILPEYLYSAKKHIRYRLRKVIESDS